jgi:hypothetical protein
MKHRELSVKSLDSVREGILNGLIIAGTIIALPPLVASLYRTVDMGWQHVMYFHLIAYLLICISAICHRRLPFFLKALIVITFCFLIGSAAIVSAHPEMGCF